MTPKTIGILTSVFLHLWSKFGEPSLSGSQVITCDTDKLSIDALTDGRTDGRTHRQTQVTTIPEGQNSSRVNTEMSFLRYFEMTNSGEASDEDFVKMATFPFKCRKRPLPADDEWDAEHRHVAKQQLTREAHVHH